MEQTNPAQLGFDPERLERVLGAIDADIAAERYDGVALCVARRGRVALRVHRGFADRAQGRRLASDAVFATMSVGKQFTNVLVLNRIERGDLRLMMPVAELIPEFGSRGKEGTPIAERRIAAAGLGDRVRARALDFLAEPLPKADVITMGMILHDWNLEKKLHLIRAAHDALPDGGAFVAIEHLIDDARRENAFGLMMSLNMLIEFGDAFDFTGADFAAWCKRIGFRETRVIPLTSTASAAVAYR